MTTERKPIRCLVIQLTRLGDTLQSLMALRAAKQLYPDLEFHFVARERFASAAKRVPWIESVVTFPTDTLLGPVISGERSQSQALSDLAKWIAPLVKEPWDFVVNWSYSEASSYLTGLLPARVKLGYSRRKDTTFSSADGWSNYIQAIVQGGIRQNIHLTDVLTTQLLTALQIHVGDPTDNGDTPVTSKSFFSLELDDREFLSNLGDSSRKWIGIQLGASRDDKTWEPENWGKFAGLLLKRHPECNIVLLGGKEDKPRAEKIQEQLRESGCDPRSVVSLVGQSDFDLWASVVSRCQWMFSGDTAAVHLASVLGTRVLNVSVGPVRWAETGPYGNGHYVLASNVACGGCNQPGEEHSCRRNVTPESAYACWSYANSEFSYRKRNTLDAHFAQIGFGDHVKNVRVYRSKIRSTNDGGGVHYEPLLSHPMNLDDWTSMVMGHIARAWYCGWVPPVGQELYRAMVSTALIQKLRELDDSSQVLAKICEEATRTAVILNKRSSTLRSDKVMRLGDRDELRELGKKLLELDDLIARLGRTSSPMQAFAQMSKVLMHNLQSTQLSDLGKESADCYRQLSEGGQILRDWIKYTLDLAKPVAIKKAPEVAQKPPGLLL